MSRKKTKETTVPADFTHGSADAGFVSPSVALPAVGLPVHSPLGASSSERWMNCTGSVALIHALKTGEGFEEEDPDYRRDGVQAHALAAWCLEHDADAWEGAGQHPALTEEMMDAVQVYLDFTRSIPGRDRYVEAHVHRPEFHELFYGTLDFAAIMATDEVANFVDYKHGAGVLVEVEHNPQLMYYGYGMIAEDREEYPDRMVINFHIVQPRGVHPAGPIRSWATTAGQIRQWAHEVLLPAMQRTINDRYLSVGEWCRFCPAKMICPAMTSLSDELTYHREQPLRQFEPDILGSFYRKAQLVKMFIKDIEEETGRRVLGGEVVPGVKAVRKRTNRVFKDGAPLEEKFGSNAWQPAELKTPPAIEKLAGGKEFVAEWAMIPDGGFTIALEDDKRAAVTVSDEAKYGDPAKYLEAGG